MKTAARITSWTCLLCAACSSASTLPPAANTTPAAPETATAPAQPPAPQPEVAAKESPPASGAAREIHFPPIARQTTSSGLELDTVELHGVPVVQIKLVIKAGSARDPKDLPGTAQLVAQMLKEGTARKSSAKIAEAVDFLGAQLNIHSDEAQTTIDMQALADQLPEALSLVAELATQPSFNQGELKKLKKRELDRLSLMSQSPNFLARREFWRALYGDHPYAHIDTTKEVVKKIRRSDLAAFHQRYFAPNNAYLVVVGDVTAQAVSDTANKVFKNWKSRSIKPIDYPPTPTRNGREIVLVDRPESVQSVIYVGNLALARTDPEYVPLLVANQVLGGSAASRLFMDLREKQSLTYGAYSDLDEGLVPMPFRAFAAVRNEVTQQAMKGFMGHLDRITTQAPPQAELTDAERLLVDSFPLHIETPAEIAGLVSELRTYGFPDNYWDGFRAQIASVTTDAALDAAKKYIRPETALIVVVGKAAAIKDALSAYGPVKVIDTEGKLVAQDAAPAHPSAAPTVQPSAAKASPQPASIAKKPDDPKDAQKEK